MANETRIEHASETWLADSTVFEVNRIPAHSDHKCYAHDPQTNEWSDLRQSLDGEWRVEVVQASDIEFNEEPFVRENFDDSAFERIQVPGHLQMAGLMNNKYVNIQYPWDGHENPTEPNIPENNHVALYRKTFTMANRLADTKNAGGTVSIVFHGMATAIYVWVNGMFVGYGEDGFTPNEFDITEMLHDGENVVAVACYEYSSASWLEDQDFWRLHGLFRSVELAAQPHVHIENMQIESDWDPESGSASLDAALTVRNAADAATISATLKNSDGNVVWETANCADPDTSISTGSLNGIHPWSAEDPVLYEFEVTVIDHAGNIAEVAVQKVGFRRFRIEDGIMTINGKRIVFKGADRHEFDPKRGRAITEQDMIDDVVFCKRHNLNAIRTSHYPNQERWYELCDEYGIYLIDETNLETHGSWCLPGDVLTEETAVPGSKAHWEGACVDRVNSMVRRDYNHPSVLIWSLGNESYTGDVFRAMYKRVHDIDPNRPVHYEGVTHNRDYDDVTDIETRMYAHADAIEEYLKNDPQKPYISCEYMHAMGNSCGNMDEYTALEHYPKYQGGFIWDYMDQALRHTDALGRSVLGYGGDFADRNTDYNFSGNGIVYADGAEKPAMQDVRYWYDTPARRAAHDARNAAAAARADRDAAKAQAARKPGTLTVTEGDGNLGVRGDGFEILFSAGEAGPSSLTVNGSEWLWRAPRPAFWRAATDNDRGCGFPQKAAAWLAADVYLQNLGFAVLQKSADGVQVRYTYGVPTVPGAKAELTYTVEPQGTLLVEAVYHGVPGAPELPCFGVKFQTFAPVARTLWTGLSGETYPDRCKGGVFGCHEEVPHIEPALVPQDCGLHVGTRQFTLEQHNACGQTAAALTIEQADAPFAFSALPNTAQEIEAAQHSTELPATGRTSVTILGAARGVGGIDSWGTDVEEPYRVSGEGEHRVAFRIVL